MKKNLIIFLSLPIFLFGCSNNIANEIDAEIRTSNEGLTANQEFSQQVNESRIISDFLNFFSKDTLFLKDSEFLVSNIAINGIFDKQSSLIGNVSFQKSTTKLTTKDELSEINFDINSESKAESDSLSTSGNLSLMYKNGGLYTMLHDFGIYMGEGNMTAKMYNLFSDLLIDRRIDLEVNSEGGIVSISEDSEPSEIINSFIKIITTPNNSDDNNTIISKNTETLLNFIDSYTKLGFSIEGLNLSDSSESFSTFSDGIIQKHFSGNFTCNEASFIMNYISSTKGIEITIGNIHSFTNNEDLDYKINISIKEKKPDYHITATTTKSGQTTFNIDGTIRFNDSLNFDGNVVLEPLQLITGQKISGNVKGIISREISTDFKFPELTGDILLLHEIAEYL